MKYVVKHYEGGFQVLESEDGAETLIASFHKKPQMQTGRKSLAQQRAEEYCDFLNQRDISDETAFDFD